MSAPKHGEPRNFNCPETEKPCTDPRCRRDLCVERNAAEAAAKRQKGLEDAKTFVSEDLKSLGFGN
jgi:hypothetical protein